MNSNMTDAAQVFSFATQQSRVINARVYATVNNGVYRAGFATTQEAYEEAFAQLFETLDFLGQIRRDGGARRFVLAIRANGFFAARCLRRCL